MPPPRFDPRKPQALTEVLGRTSEFLALRAGVEQVTALQRDLVALLPDYLGSNVEPGFIKDGVLALFAAHNALAARLRHIEPRLLVDLQQRGWGECPEDSCAAAGDERCGSAQTSAHVCRRGRRAANARRNPGAVAASGSAR